MKPVRTSESGYALIEVIVSAVALAIIALAVLGGIDGAIGSSAREKARAVATTLAENDQERLRAMRAETLETLAESQPVSVDGVTYTVESEGRMISDATGGTQSCTNDEPQVDYLQITSTVTPTASGIRTPPITINSIVAPPVSGALGTLAVQVNDRDGNGLAGKAVSIVGPTSRPGTTNDLGCAIFSRIPVGNYEVVLNIPGYVDEEGDERSVESAEVANGTVKLVEMPYDVAGSVTVSAVTTDPRNGGAGIASQPVNLTAFNGGADSSLRRLFSTTLPTVGYLFPFPSAYGFYTGACAESDPGADWFTTHPDASEVVDRGSTTGTVTVEQPALNVRVGRRANNGTYDYTYADGRNNSRRVTVYARLVAVECSDDRTFVVDGLGWVTRAPSPAPFDSGLPFGEWRVCAETAGGSRRSHELLIDERVAAQVPPGADVTQVLDPWRASASRSAACFS